MNFEGGSVLISWIVNLFSLICVTNVSPRLVFSVEVASAGTVFMSENKYE